MIVLAKEGNSKCFVELFMFSNVQQPIYSNFQKIQFPILLLPPRQSTGESYNSNNQHCMQWRSSFIRTVILLMITTYNEKIVSRNSSHTLTVYLIMVLAAYYHNFDSEHCHCAVENGRRGITLL